MSNEDVAFRHTFCDAEVRSKSKERWRRGGEISWKKCGKPRLNHGRIMRWDISRSGYTIAEYIQPRILRAEGVVVHEVRFWWAASGGGS